jgi:hypothetical protein
VREYLSDYLRAKILDQLTIMTAALEIRYQLLALNENVDLFCDDEEN